MELRRELLLTIGLLVVLNVTQAFGVIGLLVRMGPAIDRILQENVHSISAAEEMLATFAVADAATLSAAQEAVVREALTRARNNVTEPEEEPILAGLDDSFALAVAGDPVARRATVEGLQELIAVNRDAMRQVDRDAQRLGRTGAWAAVLMGVLSFALSLVVIARLGGRFLRPLTDLHNVLAAVRRGESSRRCRQVDGPVEVRQVVEGVNKLLDERFDGEEAASESSASRTLVDTALVELLERQSTGALLVSPDGSVLRANRQALAALASESGEAVRVGLAGLSGRGETAAPPFEAIALREVGWLCLLSG